MKNYCVTIAIACALIIAIIGIRQTARAQNTTTANPSDGTMGGGVAPPAPESLAPVIVTEMPAGYRDWRVISVSHEEGNLHSFGIILGNDTAIQAYREGTLPLPDGTIIAALHYSHVPSAENNKIFGQEQSFVPGDPSNVQFMIKDSKKYVTTGGWGFGHFVNGKPLMDKAKIAGCFECHARNTEHDMVFARYAP